MRTWFFLIIVIITISGVALMNLRIDKKEYPYTVELGAPPEYNLFFGGNNSYLYQKQELKDHSLSLNPVTRFPTLGNFIRGGWTSGSTVTSELNRAEFPTGVYLHWYSLLEQQGWEVQYDFPEDIINKIRTHHFRNIVRGGSNSMVDDTHGFSFDIYAIPSGKAYIRISGGGETYLLGEVQGVPIDIDFDSYILSLGSMHDYTLETMTDRRLSLESEEFQDKYRNGELSFSSAPWDRRMKRYRWELVGDAFYQVKGPYNSDYTNGEMYNIYENGQNTFHDRHAPPNHVVVYLEGTELSLNPGKVERFRFRLDDEEIMSAFEKVEALDPEGIIKLEVIISADLKGYKVLLTNGTKGIRLNPTMFKREDIPYHYRDIQHIDYREK